MDRRQATAKAIGHVIVGILCGVGAIVAAVLALVVRGGYGFLLLLFAGLLTLGAVTNTGLGLLALGLGTVTATIEAVLFGGREADGPANRGHSNGTVAAAESTADDSPRATQDPDDHGDSGDGGASEQPSYDDIAGVNYDSLVKDNE